MHFSTLFTTVGMFGATGWAQYVLQDDFFAGGNFFDQFSFMNGPDPTHGFVDYVSKDTANNNGLIESSGSNIIMRVDNHTVTPEGRPSVRIESSKSYDSGLIIVDIEHMPGSICGTWPAFWTFGPNWPNSGEIDIIEGVNDQKSNAMALHTGPSCSISDNGAFSGSIKTPNCDVNAPDQANNAGCGIKSDDTSTYGDGFNAIGGGVYATDITSEAVSIWFFPRSSIPSDISSGNPNPASWGKPLAKFQGSCDIAESIKQQSIVFDTTFCGDWAGNTWGSSSCASKANSCNDFVANNPEAFDESYWSVKGLKVYSAGSADFGDQKGVKQPLSASQTASEVVSQTPSAVSTKSADSVNAWDYVVPAASSAAPAPSSPSEQGQASNSAPTKDNAFNDGEALGLSEKPDGDGGYAVGWHAKRSAGKHLSTHMKHGHAGRRH